MKDNFIELFEYTHYSNVKVLELILNNLSQTSERTQKLFNHIINAQQIWNARILNTKPFDVWQINDWTELQEINDFNYKSSLKILDAYPLDKSIEYQNSKGEIFSNKIQEVLYHIINHSTYHRAQIATDLKQNGIEPLNTDYIFYRRKINI